MSLARPDNMPFDPPAALPRFSSVGPPRVNGSVRRMWNDQTDRDMFVQFLLEAKHATYAGLSDEATVAPLVPGSKQLEYRRGATHGALEGFALCIGNRGAEDLPALAAERRR